MFARQPSKHLFKKKSVTCSLHYPLNKHNRIQPKLVVQEFKFNPKLISHAYQQRFLSNFNIGLIARENNRILLTKYTKRKYHATGKVNNNNNSGKYFLRSLGMYGGLFGLSFLTPFVLGSVLVFLFYYAFETYTTAGENGNPEDLLLSDNMLQFLKLIPTRLGSRIWGWATHLNLHPSLRVPIYRLYSSLFGCHLDEMTRDLKDYTSLNDFFTRRLKDGVRNISTTPLVSPVDGTVLHFGKAEENWVEQIKGIRYRIESMLGQDALNIMNECQSKAISSLDSYPDNLYYMVIYLAPGDYHGIHSPVDWTIKQARHFPGHLFSVSPKSNSMIRDLLAVNERICLNGFWDYGFFSLTPVGAYNVGSITLEFDKKVKTNLPEQSADGPHIDSFYQNLKTKKGECISFFNLGSTVVLLFQAPDQWNWHVNEYDKVKLGQPLGSFKSKTN